MLRQTSLKLLQGIWFHEQGLDMNVILKIRACFFYVAAISFFAMGMVTLLALAGMPKAFLSLNEPDPVVIFLSTRNALSLASVLLLMVSAFTLVAGEDWNVSKLCLIAWLSGILILYRAGLAVSHSPDLIVCIGILDGAFGLRADAATMTLSIMELVLGFLSLSFLTGHWAPALRECVKAKARKNGRFSKSTAAA